MKDDEEQEDEDPKEAARFRKEIEKRERRITRLEEEIWKMIKAQERLAAYMERTIWGPPPRKRKKKRP